MIIQILFLFLINAVVNKPTIMNSADPVSINESIENCTWEQIPLYGKVKFVKSFPDIKVKIVDNFPDLNVKYVDAFPDKCGRWQIVESFPDIKVQLVDAFPDITIKIVDSFPGVP